MAWNLPDDWGSYYRCCERCGKSFHASEGDCDCSSVDDLKCSCGENLWDTADRDDNPHCLKCGSGPLTDGIHRVKTHTARKFYYGYGGDIRPGDTYRKTVSRDYYVGGPWGRWTIRRERISKGYGWADQHTVEPKPEGWDIGQGWPLGEVV